ncbi:MAG TPA: putative 2OG-Fe(II) oxygenase [Gemmataceae bacterium]|jgi:hypothetical protein
MSSPFDVTPRPFWAAPYYQRVWRDHPAEAACGGRKDHGNLYVATTSVDPPVHDGLLILFPSYLLHSALPYTGALDRIVISFNARVLPA